MTPTRNVPKEEYNEILELFSNLEISVQGAMLQLLYTYHNLQQAQHNLSEALRETTNKEDTQDAVH